MENLNVIEFHHTRDFSKKMNVTFEFIRQNFKALGKSILFIAGPPVLVASMMIGSFIGEFFTAWLLRAIIDEFTSVAALKAVAVWRSVNSLGLALY